MNLNKHINHFKTALIIVAITAALTGCNKEFLTDPQPTDAVSGTDVFKSKDGVHSYFTGIYRNMRSQWQNLETPPTAGNSTDAWGYNSVNAARVNKGIDIINPGGWYQFDYRHENREPTYRRTIFTWGFFYEVINQANVIIEGVAKSATIAESDKKTLTAEARALRGWLYFELIREFQHTILKDPNAPGIPIYTVPTSLDNKGAPRGTVKAVYDLINSDIAFATQNLSSTRILKNEINLQVAWGMAARIALEQARWAEAKDAAIKARVGYALDASGYRDGYTDLSSPEVIWGFPQTQENGGQTLYYGTPSSFYEKTGNGYDNFFAASTLVSMFTATDIRNNFFLSSATPTSSARYSTNKFGIPGNDDIDLTTGEIVKLKETDFNESLPMMRTAEMYLIEAEAKAELADATAGNILYAVQKNRDTSAIKSGNTGAALVSEILIERRKEFYGELGMDYLDIKRRQLPLVRAGNHPAAYRFNMPANDNRLIMKIPQKEIDSNDFIAPADQNP